MDLIRNSSIHVFLSRFPILPRGSSENGLFQNLLNVSSSRPPCLHIKVLTNIFFSSLLKAFARLTKEATVRGRQAGGRAPAYLNLIWQYTIHNIQYIIYIYIIQYNTIQNNISTSSDFAQLRLRCPSRCWISLTSTILRPDVCVLYMRSSQRCICIVYETQMYMRPSQRWKNALSLNEKLEI